MKSTRTLVSVLVLLIFAISVVYAAPPAISDTTKKAIAKEKVAATEKAKSTTTTGTKHVKGYTTKSGKVVKGYERKVTTKTKEPEKMTKPTTKVTKSTKATKATKTKTVSKGTKGGMGPAPGMVHVKGYCKKNGVCVKDYWRHAPTKK